MADKISLEKHATTSDVQEINNKLDFLIDEVKNIRRDMENLQSQNSEKLYQLDSRFYKLCGDLQHQIYEFQNKFYSGNKNITEEIRELQTKTTHSKVMERLITWFPAFVGMGLWFIIMLVILFD